MTIEQKLQSVHINFDYVYELITLKSEVIIELYEKSNGKTYPTKENHENRRSI